MAIFQPAEFHEDNNNYGSAPNDSAPSKEYLTILTVLRTVLETLKGIDERIKKIEIELDIIAPEPIPDQESTRKLDLS